MTSISVVVPVRDEERYLAAALASVAAQTVLPSEVIVVDDGSTDGTVEVARRSLVPLREGRLIRQPGAGQAAAVNRGVAAARGELVAFLDADDLWVDDAIERRLALLGDPAVDVACGATVNFFSPELDVAPAVRVQERALRAELFGAMVVRATALDRVGPVDESLRTGGIIDWVSRARAIGVAFAFVDDVVLQRRIHGTNLGRARQADRNADLLSIVRAHHVRRSS